MPRLLSRQRHPPLGGRDSTPRARRPLWFPLGFLKAASTSALIDDGTTVRGDRARDSRRCAAAGHKMISLLAASARPPAGTETHTFPSRLPSASRLPLTRSRVAGSRGGGLTIWGAFLAHSGEIKGGKAGDIATDHYHRWRSDAAHEEDHQVLHFSPLGRILRRAPAR